MYFVHNYVSHHWVFYDNPHFFLHFLLELPTI
jgi:hypothetical protein